MTSKKHYTTALSNMASVLHIPSYTFYPVNFNVNQNCKKQKIFMDAQFLSANLNYQ
uniref:Uncharacterized protein n=1 Tax=Arion vulgaris TaxID=1028688 RepID=A0A0B6ZS32_9EUPU